MSDLVFKDVREQARIYHFPTGPFRVEHVVKVAVSASTHQLETTDGRKYIIPNGWHAIEIGVDKWSF
jgi:hypothetical protein